MWEEGCHTQIPIRPSLDVLSEAKGKLSDKDAQIWFTKYCYSNPTFTVKLLTGWVDLYPIQDILIRAFFLRDFSLLIAGRGFSKSFTISIFIVLYAIFNPKTKIIVCSGTFRQSKLIFKQIEQFLDDPRGTFLRQCVTKSPSHLTDCHEMGLNGSLISAVPLTERIRGMRANLVVTDELFLVGSSIMNSVIKPFLNVRYKAKEQDELKRAEDTLIKEGKLKEADRTPMINNKMIGASSASFQVEALYKEHYLPYISSITDKDAKGVNHFVARLSYEVAPEGLLDMAQIEQAKRSSSSQEFDKEYRAIFLGESGGYFSLTHILAASVEDGYQPTIKLVGDRHKKHILAIDPNYSDSETADDFAMCVLELDEETQAGTLVHAYALSNSSISKRSEYLKYILDNFNIVFIVVDVMGGPKFIEDSKQFLGGFTKDLSWIQGDFMGDEQELKDAANSYNYTSGKIMFAQVFSKNGWFRIANETLKANLEYKRIQFASRVFNDADLNALKHVSIPLGLEYAAESADKRDTQDSYIQEEKMKIDFAAHIHSIVELTKTQMSFIDATTTDTGIQRFDLPKSQRANRGINRVRKDSYVALLMASWGMKCYFDILRADIDTGPRFRPRRVGR